MLGYAVLERVSSPGDLVDEASMHVDLLEGTGVLSAHAQKLINVYRATDKVDWSATAW